MALIRTAAQISATIDENDDGDDGGGWSELEPDDVALQLHEAAAMLGKSTDAFDYMVWRDKIPYTRTAGGRRRFRRSDIYRAAKKLGLSCPFDPHGCPESSRHGEPTCPESSRRSDPRRPPLRWPIMTTVYFGDRWDKPNDPTDDSPPPVQVATPAGEPCYNCKETIQHGDRGVMRAILFDIELPTVAPIHIECEMIHIIGHDHGVCSCTGFDTSTRAAALELLRRMNARRRSVRMGPL